MTYVQVTSHERHVIAALRREGLNQAEVAEHLGRHRSTISREVRRNRCATDGRYRAIKADRRARMRRSRSRRNHRFGEEELAEVERQLKSDWSPEQVSGRLKNERGLWISHETIYRHVWRDKRSGGTLHTHLRCSPKRRRKRYGAYDSRGRLAGKRHISERPAGAHNRSRVGHWEMDTMAGSGDQHGVLTLVERKTGYVLIGKLRSRKVEELNREVIRLIGSTSRPVRTITADNGTEFHGYEAIEEATGVEVYFATPYHSWERGTNENTNGLIRQYLPKRKSMARVTQRDCDWIAEQLNTRPRKRLGYRTPEECYEQ